MDYRKGLKGDPFDPLRPARLNHPTEFFLNRKLLHLFPGFRRGIDRAGRAKFKPKGVIRMGMCNHNRVRLEICNPANPALTAINHDLSTSVGNHRRGMHSMPA
jgi:hypothetical protein